jgi:predicted TPR repeat methyltransferase
MLAQAQAKSIYDHLEQRDLATLMVDGTRYDTIIAADVFIYIGALERIVGWVAASLTDGGRFAFTVEVHDGEGVKLQPSHRYAHSEHYIRALLDVAGFRDVQLSQTTLRQDRGEPISALIVTVNAPLHTSDREGEAEETMA